MKFLPLLLLPVAAFAAAPSTDWSPNLTASANWLTNVSNGEAVWDRISTLQLNADALASSQYQLTQTDTAHASLHFAGDWFPRYLALDSVAGGARLDWQHLFGRDSLAPLLTLEGSGDGVYVAETERQGVTGAITLRLGKQFRHGWRAELAERFGRYRAKSAVFDSGSNLTTLEISRDLNESTRLVLTGIWREGDVVTYAQFHRPDLLAIARDHVTLKTFHQTMTAYAVQGRTTGGKFALVHATSEESALILAYQYTGTRHTGLRFENQTITLSLVRQY